jgi:hypothetical protein
MTTSIRYTAVAVFDDRSQAEKAVAALREEGFAPEQIGLAQRPAPEPREKDEASQSANENLPGGAAVGMLVGASVGGFLAGAGAAPGAMAGGALGGVVAGLLEGGVVGGLVGGLIGMGVPQDEAHYYQRELDAGRTIVTVNAGGRYEQAQEVLLANGGRTPQSPLSGSGPGSLP